MKVFSFLSVFLFPPLLFGSTGLSSLSRPPPPSATSWVTKRTLFFIYLFELVQPVAGSFFPPPDTKQKPRWYLPFPQSLETLFCEPFFSTSNKVGSYWVSRTAQGGASLTFFSQSLFNFTRCVFLFFLPFPFSHALHF